MADNLAYENGYQDEPWSETLDGAIVLMSPRPKVNHNIVAFNIAVAFQNRLQGKKCRAFSDGIDVYLTSKDIVIPDVMIVCDRSKIKRSGVYGAPDLIVEVLSHGTAKRDRGYKKDLYEHCGVKEYWIVDPDTRSIEVYHLQNGRFLLDDVYRQLPADDDEITPEEREAVKTVISVSLYPDFSVSLDDIFYNLF